MPALPERHHEPMTAILEQTYRALNFHDFAQETIWCYIGHSKALTKHAGDFARYLDLSEDDIAAFEAAAPLHDIGKFRIDPRILFEQGALSKADKAEMQKHIHYGYETLVVLKQNPNLDHMPQTILDITLNHHERWDGSGYLGLTNTNIPYVGRAYAILDVYDALTSIRSYKPAWSEAEALEQLERGAGTEFDPALVAAFIAMKRRR